MKSKKIGLIYAFWTLLWLGIGYMEFVDWQEDIQVRVRIAFDTAMKEEKKLQIKKMAWNFDVERSPNDISGEEKCEWLEQFFLTSKDPNRHLLDSLFHTMLVQEDIGVEWSAVSCTFGGKVRAAVPIEQLKKDLLVEERHYRKDYKEENQIVLCVYIQFMALWKNGIFYGWVAVWLIGIMGILYWMRKWNVQKRCVEQEGPILHEEIVPYEPVPIRWVRLREDLLFDEEHGILKSGERTLQLQNLDLDYFRAFLWKEHYLLLKTEILTEIYGLKNVVAVSRSDSSRISQEIKNLRVRLNAFNIDIVTVRGKGYILQITDHDLSNADQ